MSDAGTDGGGGAKFEFSNQGLIVEIDSDDNSNGHVGFLTTDAGTQVSFSIFNVGSAAGAADVNVSVDGSQVQTWTSPSIQPRSSAAPDGDGFVHGCGRYAAGDHTFLATVGPTGGSSADDQTTNNVIVEDPPSQSGSPNPSGSSNPSSSSNPTPTPS